MIRLPARLLLFFVGVMLSGALKAEFRVGDCVVFHEGGEGRLLKAPSYWLRGTVTALLSERRRLEICPLLTKPLSARTREERVRFALAVPCVSGASELAEVDVHRVRLTVDAWETPWSNAHGTAGLLFRGTFMDRALIHGESIEIFSDWLASCEAAP